MTTAPHPTTDSTGLQIVAERAWDTAPDAWGIRVAHAPADDQLHGIIGPLDTVTVEAATPTIPLPAADPADAMVQLALACGLSVIDAAGLAMGETLIATGNTLLARCILVAAGLQGARTGWLVKIPVLEATTDVMLNYADITHFDSELDVFIRAGQGRLIFADTTADHALLDAMTSRMQRFGVLVFCRQESTATATIPLRTAHHLKSAHFIYWRRPESPCAGLAWQTYVNRAANLLRYRELAEFTTIVKGE
jgi:hypothetical protein